MCIRERKQTLLTADSDVMRSNAIHAKHIIDRRQAYHKHTLLTHECSKLDEHIYVARNSHVAVIS
jgi:hypothetical protein